MGQHSRDFQGFPGIPASLTSWVYVCCRTVSYPNARTATATQNSRRPRSTKVESSPLLRICKEEKREYPGIHRLSRTWILEHPARRLGSRVSAPCRAC